MDWCPLTESTNVVTRNLLAFAIKRQAGEIVDLVFKDKTAAIDGSFTVKSRLVRSNAYVVDLSTEDIERLQQGGMTIQNGISVSLPYLVPVPPDSIIYQVDTFKIMQFVISQGASLMIASKATIGFSDIEAGA